MPNDQPAPEQSLPSSEAKGRRGAPKGNINALQSGKRSKQPCPERSRRVKRLVIALMADPDTRRLLLQLRDMEHRRLLQLQQAINHYNNLLRKPSRERSIRSAGPLPNLKHANSRKTNPRPPGPRTAPSPITLLQWGVTRIILFDIDQTLLYSGGAGSLAMRRAFHQLYGIDDGFSQVESSGRTDWAILREGMRQHGILNGKDHFRREMARFQAAYYRLLEPTLYDVKGGHAMPGVPKLLTALSERDDVRLGLATGNFRKAAFIKLRHFGLDGYVSEGGFGDDAENRNEVIRVAIKRLANGARVDRDSVWVIGDTPLDIAAARANRVRSLGVATGANSARGLRAAGADIAMVDLSRTEAVLSTLLS